MDSLVSFPPENYHEWKHLSICSVKLEELRYIVYSDKFLEERFCHVLRRFIFVRKKISE